MKKCKAAMPTGPWNRQQAASISEASTQANAAEAKSALRAAFTSTIGEQQKRQLHRETETAKEFDEL